MPSRLTIAHLVAALVGLLAVAASPSRAMAAPGGGGGQGSGGKAGDVITAGVGFTDSGGAGGGDGCRWTMIDGEITITDLGTATWPRTDRNGVVYHLWERHCARQRWYYELPETDPTTLRDIALEEIKQRRIPSPEPVLQMLDPDFGWAYVRTPLDFRAGGNAWRTVSVTASLGPFWATVTATPQTLTFDSGDPNGPPPVSCGGDAPIAAYIAQSPGQCSYTYTNASSTSPYDGYHFLASLTIDWAVSWTSSFGAGGPLDGHQSSATAEVAVAEAKGLVVCTGSRPEQGGC